MIQELESDEKIVIVNMIQAGSSVSNSFLPEKNHGGNDNIFDQLKLLGNEILYRDDFDDDGDDTFEDIVDPEITLRDPLIRQRYISTMEVEEPDAGIRRKTLKKDRFLDWMAVSLVFVIVIPPLGAIMILTLLMKELQRSRALCPLFRRVCPIVAAVIIFIMFIKGLEFGIFSLAFEKASEAINRLWNAPAAEYKKHITRQNGAT